MRHIIPISGKDSLATAIVQRALNPILPYEFVYNDTEMELPDTYVWLEQVERILGISIIRLGKNLEAIIHEEQMLPSVQRRFCTRLSKIYPMSEWLGTDEATVYLGIRADEDRVGGKDTKTQRHKDTSIRCVRRE